MTSRPLALQDELGSVPVSQFFEWRKTITTEWATLKKQIMKLRSEIRTIDKQLSPLKKKNFQVTANAKIEVRRKLHKELLQYEWRFFEVNKTWKAINDIFDSAILTYARSSCLLLTQQIRVTFPRELRDLIIAFLLCDDNLDDIVKLVSRQVFQPVEIPPDNLPHIYDPDFMHPDIFQEVLEMARHLHPKFMLTYSHIPRFLETRVLGSEIFARDFFRDLRVHINLTHLVTIHTIKSNEMKRMAISRTEPLHLYLESFLSRIPARKDRVLALEIQHLQISDFEHGRLKRMIDSQVQMLVDRKNMGEFKEVSVVWYHRQQMGRGYRSFCGCEVRYDDGW